MIPFAKAHGNGNDFIIIEDKDNNYSDGELANLARKICRRKTSLGADGVLVLGSSCNGDFSMRLFNADGSEGEMCGNGARCIARYAYEKGHAKKDMVFETKSGLISAHVNSPYVSIEMGKIDIRNIKEGNVETVEARLPYLAFYVGVPHCVVFVQGLNEITRDDLLTLARNLRKKGTIFDEGTNVNFVEVKNDHLIAITYERGVEDFTLSCGTGSIACCVASHLRYNTPTTLDVKNPGGINKVTLRFMSNEVLEATLTGKAFIVAVGNFTNEALIPGEDALKDHWRNI